MTTATEQTRHGCLACGRPIPIMDWFCNDDCKQYAAMADQQPLTQPREERGEHTPTPWQLSTQYTDVLEIYNPDVQGAGWLVAQFEVPDDNDKANAAFIVRAVNSHAANEAKIAALVEVLRDIHRRALTQDLRVLVEQALALAEGKGVEG